MLPPQSAKRLWIKISEAFKFSQREAMALDRFLLFCIYFVPHFFWRNAKIFLKRSPEGGGVVVAKILVKGGPVSYTPLDVYKRQDHGLNAQ